jgi:hypothetical protein
MNDTLTEAPPTSTAATRLTEPEVLAGISSAEGDPKGPTKFRVDGGGFDYATMIALGVAGIALGYGISRLFASRG